MSTPDDRPLTLRRFLEKLMARSAKDGSGDGQAKDGDGRHEDGQDEPHVVGYVPPGESKVHLVKGKKERK